MAKILEQGPVLVLVFNAQQLTRKRAAKDEVDEVMVETLYI